MMKLSAILVFVGLLLLLISLLPWPVSGSQAAVPVADESELPSPSPIEQGQALFMAKGCATCHRHDGIAGQTGSVGIGPNLTNYRPDPDFVRRWLRDPAAIRPGTQMPNLHLTEGEIEALLAFLSREKEPVSSTSAAPASCPVTKTPDRSFAPPQPYSPDSPYEGQFWYGSETLWTLLPSEGNWSDLPHEETGYVQKTFWWREGYDWQEEPQPELTVTGRQLDGEAATLTASEATNGYHPDLKSFMLVGVDIPRAGCWEISGHYQGHDLSFVVWVAP